MLTADPGRCSPCARGDLDPGEHHDDRGDRGGHRRNVLASCERSSVGAWYCVGTSLTVRDEGTRRMLSSNAIGSGLRRQHWALRVGGFLYGVVMAAVVVPATTTLHGKLPALAVAVAAPASGYAISKLADAWLARTGAPRELWWLEFVGCVAVGLFLGALVSMGGAMLDGLDPVIRRL